MQKINVPILIIGFNRPNIIKKTFSYIQEAKPLILYIAVDGYRANMPEEENLVQEVKNILTHVDWQCEIHYKFNQKNLGAERTISSAISWVLEKEEYVIVLEDDIVSPMSFLYFAQDMLLRYKNEKNIYMISGCNFTPIESIKEDLLFAYSGHTWGWATWKRAWNNFNINVDMKISYRELKTIFLTKREIWWTYLFYLWLRLKGHKNYTWDLCWSFIRLKNKGLSIIPKNNLTSNIGTYGLHYHGKTNAHFMKCDNQFVASIFPEQIIQNKIYDQYHFNHFIYEPIYKKILKIIRRCIEK